MRALMLNETSQVSGGNYTSLLELSGACSMYFGATGGITAGIISLISHLTFETSATGAILTPPLPIPAAILMGIGMGSASGALLGLGFYSMSYSL